MRAAIFFLATIPYAAADVVDSDRPYSSQGACYDAVTHEVTCFRAGATSSNPALTQTECEAAGNVWYEKGHVGSDGCCLCDSNCDHSLETADPKTCNYADANAGGCYSVSTHTITCDVAETTCTGSGGYFYAANSKGSDGCCFCDEGCDHSEETGTDCHLDYYDSFQSDGSCYDSTTHVVTCDVSHADCEALGHYWYSPGYVGGSGCCHCYSDCNHDLETGTGCTYNEPGAPPTPQPSEKPTMAPTAAKVVADAAATTTVGILAAGAAGAAALL